MLCALQGCIKHITRDSYWYHSPLIRNNNGETVAMSAANGLCIEDLPECWVHKSDL